LSDHNPYAPPQAEVRDAPSESVGGLASRGSRLAAAIVDTVISLLVAVPIMFYSGYLRSLAAGDPVSFRAQLAIAAAMFLAFVLINGSWLAKYGQTVGKRAVGIRIVNVLDDRVPKLSTLLGRRYGLVWLVSLIPVIGTLVGVVDDLLVFRNDRRCLHDLIAGTKVVVS